IMSQSQSNPPITPDLLSPSTLPLSDSAAPDDLARAVHYFMAGTWEPSGVMVDCSANAWRELLASAGATPSPIDAYSVGGITYDVNGVEPIKTAPATDASPAN